MDGSYWSLGGHSLLQSPGYISQPFSEFILTGFVRLGGREREGEERRQREGGGGREGGEREGEGEREREGEERRQREGEK